MSEQGSLPTGWARVALTQIGILYCGQSPSVTEVNHDGRGTPYVTGPDQWDGSTLTVDKWTTNPKRQVPEGCIFITVKGAGVGTLFAGVPCAIGRDVYAYKPSNGLPRKFIEYSLRYNISQVLRHAKGDIPGLSKGHILDHVTAIPPLNEQIRIVAKVEELLSDLDASVAALERAKANLKRYRGAVLKAAVEGKLTEQWRAEHPATEPASDLLERILVERRKKWEADQLAKFAASGKEPPKNWKAKYVEPAPPDAAILPELPNGWCWATIEQLASSCPRSIQSGPFGSNLLHSEFQAEGVLAIGIDNVLDGAFSMGSQHRISAAKFDVLEKYEARPLDVLITVMATVGRCCVVPAEIERAIITKHVYRISVDRVVIDPHFVQTALSGGPSVRRQIYGELRGQTRPGINGEILKSVALPVPSLQEQLAILSLLSEELSQIDATKITIHCGLLRAARLRQSILKRAFEGKLVPQDPNDEPASVLLGRIKAKAGQATTDGKPKARKRKRSTEEAT